MSDCRFGVSPVNYPDAAFSYIILRLTYFRGLILIGRGSSDWVGGWMGR